MTVDVQDTTDFFASLAPMSVPGQAFAGEGYRPAPDDWHLAVTDVRDSTAAVARGAHRTVNFVAAGTIAALKNLCAPVPVPVLFGGDGAAVLVPARFAGAARRELARLRGMAAREHGLDLRAGLVPVGRLRQHGADLRVARFEPSPGNHFGLFEGGGVSLYEASLKGRGDPGLASAGTIPAELDDGVLPDLTGLSCRWNELRSVNGRMATIIVQTEGDPAALYADLAAVAGRSGDVRPVKPETLVPAWPPKGLWLEARAQKDRPALVEAVFLLARTLFSAIVLWREKPFGWFDPVRYREETASNTDFGRYDSTLSLVFDCSPSALDALSQDLARRADAGELRYGLHVSETALMTCLVTSLEEGLHVHFVDGGDGGYTRAAQALKATLN